MLQKRANLRCGRKSEIMNASKEFARCPRADARAVQTATGTMYAITLEHDRTAAKNARLTRKLATDLMLAGSDSALVRCRTTGVAACRPGEWPSLLRQTQASFDIARCCPAARILGKGEVLAIRACPGAPGPLTHPANAGRPIVSVRHPATGPQRPIRRPAGFLFSAEALTCPALGARQTAQTIAR